jgi:hypothetical protein
MCGHLVSGSEREESGHDLICNPEMVGRAGRRRLARRRSGQAFAPRLKGSIVGRTRMTQAMDRRMLAVQTIARRWTKRSRHADAAQRRGNLPDISELPHLPPDCAERELVWHEVEFGIDHVDQAHRTDTIRGYDESSKSFESVAIVSDRDAGVSLLFEGAHLLSVPAGQTAALLYSYAEDVPADDWMERRYHRIWFRLAVGLPWRPDLFRGPASREVHRLRDLP